MNRGHGHVGFSLLDVIGSPVTVKLLYGRIDITTGILFPESSLIQIYELEGCVPNHVVESGAEVRCILVAIALSA